MRITSTYAILKVAPATFADVRTRLERSGALGDYLGADDDEQPLIVFGSVALQAENPAAAETEPPPVELLDVPLYDSATLPADMKAVLAQTPWQRVEKGRCGFPHEVAGILIGFAIVCGDRGLENGIAGTMAQAGAEIMNLILMCGGKLPQAKAEGGETPALPGGGE